MSIRAIRVRMIPMVIPLLFLGFTSLYAKNPGSTENMYGFVVYNGNEYAPLDDAGNVIAGLGAGWMQAEGPAVMSKAAAWGAIQPDSLDEYSWDSLNWTQSAADAGLQILLTINSGHDRQNYLWDNYSRWVDCGGVTATANTCNCPPHDYQNWYDYVFAVVQHFDGVHDAPQILHFMTTGENDDLIYWLGTKDQYYDAEETVIIQRKNGAGSVQISASLVPVAFLAVHDANPNARLVAGACSAWRGYGWTHLKELIDHGSPEDAVVAQARRYSMWDSYDSIVERLATDPEVIRSVEFMYGSLTAPDTYDYYGAHFYASHGYLDGMSFLQGLMTSLGVQKPIWMTGEGRVFSTDAVGHSRSANLHFRRIIYSHFVGIEWHDVSFLVDYPCCGLYQAPQSGIDYSSRHPLADSFRLMAHVLPCAACSTPISVTSPFTDTELYAFEVTHPDTSFHGWVAAGWCSTTCPENFMAWCSPDCPRPELDLAAIVGIPSGVATTVWNVAGELIERNCTGNAPVIFAEEPFLVVWGDDTDADCVPDIVDNCPLIPNGTQANNPAESIEGAHNPAIPALDWIGDACDPCPEDGDPDCTVPCIATGVQLSMPDHTFRAGDACWLHLNLCNAEDTDLVNYPVFVLLDVYGEYWFAPSWSQTINFYNLVIHPGLLAIEVIPSFAWPSGVGSANGIYFHAAITDPAVTFPVGIGSSWEFGWE